MSLLQMSFSGAVFILAVVVIRAITINQLPKRTFLILWGIVFLRLLIPFTIPSVFSVYSFVDQRADTAAFTGLQMEQVIPAAPRQQIEMIQGQNQLTAEAMMRLPVWLMIWLTGMIVCAAFYIISYLRLRFEFQTSLPVQNEFVEQWLNVYQLKRSISIRQSDRISAPLTYGILNPVILMPKQTDWKNTKQLEYIFMHEYVHIRRYDTVTKLVSVLVLCIHWFNPLVWVMHILFNRDIELACDESVVHRFGEISKSTYAFMLINMESKKSGFMPFCSSFSKNAIEERITAIMKIKKNSVFAILIAAVLVIGVTTAFTTSAAGRKEEKRNIPNTGFSDEEFDQLLALQFDGYENMSIKEYQNKVWEMTDTEEYKNLLERFSQDNTLYEMKDNNQIASFLFYTLEPLTAERWQTREFGGFTTTDYPGASDNAIFEFSYSLTIQKADTLTVGEYNDARSGVGNRLQVMLQDKTEGQLQDYAFMQEEIKAEIESLTKQWSSDKLQISVVYDYMPLSEPDTDSNNQQSTQQEEENRDFPNGTKEDYGSLLTLKTRDYQDMPVADFNMDLLDWANEDYDRMERINCDISYQDFAVPLNSEELSFVNLSVYFSTTENTMYVRSDYTGKPEEDPSYNQNLPEKTKEEGGRSAWCNLFYQFSYHITDKETLTVRERDRCVDGMIGSVRQFWDETDIEDMLKMSEEDIVKKLNEIAAEYSNSNITITVLENGAGFESMDERDRD